MVFCKEIKNCLFLLQATNCRHSAHSCSMTSLFKNMEKISLLVIVIVYFPHCNHADRIVYFSHINQVGFAKRIKKLVILLANIALSSKLVDAIDPVIGFVTA